MQVETIGLRSYRRNNSKTAKALEKLSTGRKINRAGDGAAELSISEKMKAQITGMNRAGENVKDAISLVKTGEAAMDEIHSLLHRMSTLAAQSANGTYDDSVDRMNLQREVQQLKAEIDRISETTNFNGLPLLRGSGVADVHNTVSSVTGVQAVQAKQQGAVWEGTLDLSDVGDGSYVTIDGKTFEFNSKGQQLVSGSILINFDPTQNSADKLNLLQTAVHTACPNLQVTVSGKNVKIEQKAGTFNTSGHNISVTRGECTPDVGVGTKHTCNSVGSFYRAIIQTINADYIQDGSIIRLFGVDYKINCNGENNVDSNASKTLDLSISSADWKIAEKRMASIETAINNKLTDIFPSSSTIKCRRIFEDPTYKIQIQWRKTDTGVSGSWTDADFGIIKGTHTSTPVKDVTNSSASIYQDRVDPKTASREESLDVSCLKDGDTITIDGKTYEFDTDGKVSTGNVQVTIPDPPEPNEIATNLSNAFNNNKPAANPADSELTMTATAADGDFITIYLQAKGAVGGQTIELEYALANDLASGNVFTFQIGASSSETLTVNIAAMSTSSLSITTVDVSQADIALDSMQLIRDAVNLVSQNRGLLGAVQNRLEHTSRNLGVASENLTDAESVIADTNMGKEVVELTKSQILSQSAQSMLAQSMGLMRDKIQRLLAF